MKTIDELMAMFDKHYPQSTCRDDIRNLMIDAREKGAEHIIIAHVGPNIYADASDEARRQKLNQALREAPSPIW